MFWSLLFNHKKVFKVKIENILMEITPFLQGLYGNYFTKLIAAIVILLIGVFVGRFVGNLLKKLLNELNTDKILKEEAGVKVPIEDLFGNALKYLIYFAAIIMALNQLGLATTILYIILIVILIVIIILIILAFKDFIPNVTAGFFIHQKRNLKEGDKIKVGDVEGEILHINLVETKIKNKNGDVVFIPNSMLMKDKVKKKSRK